MKKGLLFIVILFLQLTSAKEVHAQLTINEIMASNSNTISDGNGEFDDWVEIYNAGDLSVNLAGMYVSDDPDNPTKWQIPNTSSAQTTVSAEGYLILWLDSDTEQGAGHIDFKLSADGEHFSLTDTDGSTVIDSVSFGEQMEDISFGRSVDGAGSFGFLNPTPNASNNGSGIDQISAAPGFSLASGFYASEVTIGLTAANGAEIRFETGGKVPTISSQLYTTPISFDTSTVVRAIAIESGKQPSTRSTNTYIFADQHTIPVVSFVMDPDSLFDFDKGMYVIGDSAQTTGVYPFKGANFWEDFQYPVSIEFLNESGNTEFEFDAEAEIGGNFSRGFLKKSFIINNNAEFGFSALEYPLFEENEYDEYDGFVLRAGAEERSRLLNELMREINLDWGHKNAMQAYRYSALYINGQYWGIYNIYERKNDDFVESRYGVDDIDMIKDYDEVKDGDIEAYETVLENFLNASLQGDEFFQYADSVIDLESFTDHWIYQVYTSHGDPNNLRYWRPQEEGGKWHYISHDFDWWRNLGAESNEYYLSLREFLSREPDGFWLFGRMMANPTYKEIFLNRFADMMNTAFQPDYLLPLISELNQKIGPEIPRDIARWSDGWYDISGFTEFDMEYIRESIEEYVVEYPAHLYSEIADTLGNDTLRVTLKSTLNGTVTINSLTPDVSTEDWSGLYFSDTEISLNASPEFGYQIANWMVNGEVYSTDSNIKVGLNTDPIEVSVTFEEISELLIINEINYNSSDDFDTGDWIEIYNPLETDVDMSGWIFKDEDDTHEYIIPDNTIIKADGYLVIANDTASLKTVNADARYFIGDFDFGLSGNSDDVRLFNSSNTLIDVVSYDDESPWPTEPDANGATLELIDSEMDNALPASWMASSRQGGTPGWENGTIPTSIDEEDDQVDGFTLNQNYPNPFNPTTTIGFTIPQSTRIELAVFNILGQKVETLLDENVTAGSHTVTFDASGLASGIYLYQLKTLNTTLTQRMVLLK